MYKHFEKEWSEHYFRFVMKHADNHLDWSIISSNPNITLDVVKNHPEIEWDWSGISSNPNITWDIIKDNPDKRWNWRWVSQNPNITWKIIQNNPEQPWDWNYVNEILKYPDKAWDWNELSIHSNITWDIIINHPEKPWNWREISMNPNINWDIIENNPNEKWSNADFNNWSVIFTRGTIEHVCKDYKWNFVHLNPMTKAKEDFIRNRYRNHFERCGLKEELMSVVWNPRNMWKFKYLDPDIYGDNE